MQVGLYRWARDPGGGNMVLAPPVLGAQWLCQGHSRMWPADGKAPALPRSVTPEQLLSTRGTVHRVI